MCGHRSEIAVLGLLVSLSIRLFAILQFSRLSLSVSRAFAFALSIRDEGDRTARAVEENAVCDEEVQMIAFIVKRELEA